MPLDPLVPARGAVPAAERRRVSRQLLLDGFGPDAQARLAGARVLVVGAGGLGSPVLAYLAAAGVGTLGVVDDDVVEPSNLQRQLLHGAADVGRPKTSSAAVALAALQPGVTVVEHTERLDERTAPGMLDGYDVVVDGSDTFATRYAVSDAAARLGLPVVWGTVLGWDGQVAVWWSAAPDGRALTYPDVFGPSPGEDGASCETVGVLGPACGAVGATMAVEAVKLLTGTGDVALGRLLVYDARASTWDTVELAPPRASAAREPGDVSRGVHPAARPSRPPASPIQPLDTPPGSRASVLAEASGTEASGEGARARSSDPRWRAPSARERDRARASSPGAVGELVLDVGPAPGGGPAGAVWVRLEDLAAGEYPDGLAEHPHDAPVVVVCPTGLRSRGAARLLEADGFTDVRPRAARS